MRRILTILILGVLTALNAWADRRAEGDAVYERFNRWRFEQKTDSVLLNKDAALKLLADNRQWEHYYYVANLAIQMQLLNDNNPSACLRECQQLYKFATEHYHEYGRASVQAQMGWVYGYIGDHQEAARQLRQSIETIERLKIVNRDVLGIYYVYAYILELTGNYDEQQRIIDEGNQKLQQLGIDRRALEENQLVADQLQNTEALMLVHRGRLDRAQPLIKQIEQKLASGEERSVYEAWRAVAEYRLATGDYARALEATKPMEQYLQGHRNSGLLWGLNLLRSEILRKLGHSDAAYDTLRHIIEERNTANINQLRRQLSEMDAQYQMDEMRIQEQKNHFWWAVSVSLIIICALLIFTVFRYLAGKRLKSEHEKLLDAYDRLEETTSAKERIESELRIARDIQMSMVPSTFPHCEGLDMHAAMTPARAVGGDLYGYLLKDKVMYFCVGDVSGKGVPASLFMAQATRLFQTMADQGMPPAEICTHMNQALSGEDNTSGMFVTMFLGLVDLGTGHLSFCNAGHNPPAIIGQPGQAESHFIQMETNAPIGLFPEMEYVGEEIETIKGRPLFIYSDGLTEAENRQQQLFGEERLLDILNTQHCGNAQELIELLMQEVERHRDGAEANDDLTMMCICVK